MAPTHDGSSSEARPEVVLYTRVDCSLCEKAEAALIALCEPLGFDLTTHDVDQDATLVERYGDRVPVVAYGGRELAEGSIDAHGLRDILRAALGLL
jgi:glutaredoxin